jgi:ribosomal protein S18 acetylase RimI-like enzyme
MFDVKIDFDDISITSVEKEDIKFIDEWLNSQKNYIEKPALYSIGYDELYERFIEYYVNECEIFLIININGKLSGILKGRIEFKTPSEVMFWCFFIDNSLRNKGIGSRVINEVISYFNKMYGIQHFFTSAMEEEKRNIKFWKDNGFKVLRIAKNFYEIDGMQKDMIILKKHL